MPKVIQIRNVPDSLHRIAKARAATAGMSLSDYLLREIKRLMKRPTMEEVLARLDKRQPVSSSAATEILRKERRKLLDELTKGVLAMKAQREGKVALRTYHVKPKPSGKARG